MAVADVLASFTQIFGLRHAFVVDALFDAAPDMPTIYLQHGLDVGVARWPDNYRLFDHHR